LAECTFQWRANNKIQAIYALNRGDVFEAYHLYIQAGMHGAAHDLAVFELAPEAVIRNDLELLQVLFERFVGHSVDGWHVGGKVCKIVTRSTVYSHLTNKRRRSSLIMHMQ
jgi:hypothetical protein